MPIPSAALFGAPAGLPAGGPASPSIAPAAPAGPSVAALNAAALLGLQGQTPSLPPQYKVDVQPNGSLLLREIHPDGSSNIVKIVSAPKRFGDAAQQGGAK